MNVCDPWNDPAALCTDMVTDFSAAVSLIKKYPDRFTVVRYEDFALDVFQKTPELFKFLGLPYHEKVYNFLKDHTRAQDSDTNSTVFNWKNNITYDQLEFIQERCYSAMKLWGYKVARTEEELRTEFYPIYDFDYSFSQI